MIFRPKPKARHDDNLGRQWKLRLRFEFLSYRRCPAPQYLQPGRVREFDPAVLMNMRIRIRLQQVFRREERGNGQRG
jgi:hypothetical protein